MVARRPCNQTLGSHIEHPIISSMPKEKEKAKGDQDNAHGIFKEDKSG
jgi:hypothetical protein